VQTKEYINRIRSVSSQLAEQGSDLILITPGADLRYLTGYDALPLERLTCLAITKDAQATLIVPTLEKPAALTHDLDNLGIELIDFTETQNPYALLADFVGQRNKNSIENVLVSNLMWVEKAFKLQDAFGFKVGLAGDLIANLRSIKTDYEITALHEAGQAIDNVHQQMDKWLRPGRTEREVGRDIANAIIESGHSRVDFVIVASGPNGASPHHELSDRIINPGEPVVVDIGGTMPSGYCSDSTRMYVCGKAPEQFVQAYKVLQLAQAAASEAAVVGVTCEDVDATAREILTSANLGEFFIHRTGHGIGLETHEDPYIVKGNDLKIVNGHAFSIEPGFYIPGEYGARIEDILVCQNGKSVSTNNTSRDLVEL
jgi:Xaa-Pro aminopeptidase